jgi:threonine/homoserine/homoserine lactone efflux protein
MNMKTFLSLLLTTLFVSLSNGSALACAACYGDTTGSKMGNAAAVGIFAMVVIMFAMLGTILYCGYVLAQRAKNPGPDYDELLREDNDETLPHPGPAS